MPLPWALLVLVGAVVVATFVGAHVHRVSGAALHATSGPTGMLTTELGRFRYDPERGVLRVWPKRGDASQVHRDIPVDQGSRLYDVTETKQKLISDLLLDGGLSDLLPAFRDQDFATTLLLETSAGPLPLMCLRQYRRYDLVQAKSEFVLSWLRLFRMYEDIQAVVLAKHAELSEALRQLGLRVT